MNRIGNVQLWVRSNKLTFILLRLEYLVNLRIMGSASLERNVLNAKSRVLVFMPFSDTSFYCGNPLRLEMCPKMASIFTNEYYLLI